MHGKVNRIFSTGVELYWPLKSMLIDLNMVIGINHKRVTIVKFQRIPLQQTFEGNYFYVN